MSRIIVIADADYQITFDNLKPLEALPGGTLLNTAIALAQKGCATAIVSEVGNDIIGDIILSHLAENGIDTRSVDRSVDCATPATLIFNNDGKTTTMRYTGNPDSSQEGLDVVWPDIEQGDTILFGGYMAVNPRCRRHLMQLLTHASERKINIIYFPGFDPSRVSRITKVMPMIFENLEIASTVVTRTSDISFIFNQSDPSRAFSDHLDFYVDNYINIDDNRNATFFKIGHQPSEITLDTTTCPETIADAIIKTINQ